MSARPFIAIVGAGPAGLMAADVLSAAGQEVRVFERMPSVGRKFLMAGRGGLNLTHTEPLEKFAARYGDARARIEPMLAAFTPNDLRAWADALGAETFVGSSGRVFPKAMKASPLLRALLERLARQGVLIRTRMEWRGWDAQQRLLFRGPDGAEEAVAPAAALLALGGASWPKLGGDGRWRDTLIARGVAVAPFQPSNMGFNVAWSETFKSRFAGAPLKGVALRFADHVVRGEIMISAYGVEGGAIYALSAPLRDALSAGSATLSIDLRPDLSAEEIAAKLARGRAGDSRANLLRKALALPPVAINLLRETQAAPPPDAAALARHIKDVRLTLISAQPLARAISSAGGVSWSAVDDDLMLRAAPGVFAAGEMLDWEAPTGGYLLQACLASGVWAARAMLARLAGTAPGLAAPAPPC